LHRFVAGRSSSAHPSQLSACSSGRGEAPLGIARVCGPLLGPDGTYRYLSHGIRQPVGHGADRGAVHAVPESAALSSSAGFGAGRWQVSAEARSYPDGRSVPCCTWAASGRSPSENGAEGPRSRAVGPCRRGGAEAPMERRSRLGITGGHRSGQGLQDGAGACGCVRWARGAHLPLGGRRSRVQPGVAGPERAAGRCSVR